MAWTARDWYLGEHRSALFDRNGNAGPTVWSDGRVVGGWASGASGGVVVRLLEDVGSEASVAIEAEADRSAGGSARPGSRLDSVLRWSRNCPPDPDPHACGTSGSVIPESGGRISP